MYAQVASPVTAGATDQLLKQIEARVSLTNEKPRAKQLTTRANLRFLAISITLQSYKA